MYGKRLIIFILIAALGIAGIAAAPKVRITVSQQNTAWSDVDVGPTDIIGGPGGDFAAEYESVVDFKLLDIKNANGNWRIDIRKTDAVWDSNVTLYVRRSSDGTGGTTITGGTAYQAVTNTDATFFSGSGDWSNIGVQFKVSGAYASAGVDIGTYTTTLTYTITDGL